MFGQNKRMEAILSKGLLEQQSALVSALSEAIKEARTSSLPVTEEFITDEEKRRAAYALNLCTVSISQIVDYNDLNILEQEYEGILNNLNLENFPKDEALLKILKQILDTVTFFRIQEGDKIFIEREYEQKMKNAIWSAVPNFGLIVAGGNPYTMLISLASQVGIGYMNYRKQKAENGLERDKERWQLQRSAIEQFNALKRELFDTAWRLADKYKFNDNWRLTDKQVSQYNDTLMDSNALRKYTRLEMIEDHFQAYPPFWYYYGHTALEVSSKYEKEKSAEHASIFRIKAKEHFKKFLDIYYANEQQILREDHLAAAACLESISLLNSETERDVIVERLRIAMKNAGNSMDIIQFCAYGFLRIEDYPEAELCLKKLVVEDFNAITNGQLLSSVYVNRRDVENGGYEDKYKLLTHFVPQQYLFPWNPTRPLEDLKNDFIEEQRNNLQKTYHRVIQALIDKQTILLNRTLQKPSDDLYYPDSFFRDDRHAREERFDVFKRTFSRSKQKGNYLRRIRQYDIADVYFETLNHIAVVINNNLKDVNSDYSLITKAYNAHIEEFNQLNDAFSGNSCEESFKSLFDLKIGDFLNSYIDGLTDSIKTRVQSIDKMEDITKAENDLAALCDAESLLSPTELVDGSALMQDEIESCKPATDPVLLIENNRRKVFLDTIQQFNEKLDIGILIRDNETKEFWELLNKCDEIRSKGKTILAILPYKKGSIDYDYRDCLFMTESALYIMRGSKWYSKIKLLKIDYERIELDKDTQDLIEKDNKTIIIKKAVFPHTEELYYEVIREVAKESAPN